MDRVKAQLGAAKKKGVGKKNYDKALVSLL